MLSFVITNTEKHEYNMSGNGLLHSEHHGQSLDQASDVCRRSNMLRKLTFIAGSSYSSAALNEIIP